MRSRVSSWSATKALILSLTLLLSFAYIPVARAQVTEIVNATGCADLQGSWVNSTSTCTMTRPLTITQNGSLIIPSGATLVVVSILNYGGIRIFGSLFMNNGTSGNYGRIDIDNSGSLYNNGTINNYSDGYMIIEGSVTNDKGGRIENSGLVNIVSGGSIQNNGAIYQESGSSMTVYGTLWNGGGIINYGTIDNLGTINTYDFIDNEATIQNSGTIDNTDTIHNYGTITNECGGILSNASGATFAGNDVVTSQCTTTSMTTETSPTNSTEMTGPTNSTAPGGTNSTGTSGYSGEDIPEFPFQVLAPIALTLIVVLAYVAVRGRNNDGVTASATGGR